MEGAVCMPDAKRLANGIIVHARLGPRLSSMTLVPREVHGRTKPRDPSGGYWTWRSASRLGLGVRIQVKATSAWPIPRLRPSIDLRQRGRVA